jgi:hypothetical protein
MKAKPRKQKAKRSVAKVTKPTSGQGQLTDDELADVSGGKLKAYGLVAPRRDAQTIYY